MSLDADERGLVARIARGGDVDEASQALAELMERHKALVYAIAIAITHERSVADDVFQETFLRLTVWLRQHPDVEIRSFPRLLTAFVRRVAWELGRMNRRLVPLEEMDVASPLVKQIYLRELLDSVPEEARQVLELTLVQGWSSQEAAARLGLTAENVRVIKHRALRVIREGQQVDLAAADAASRPL